MLLTPQKIGHPEPVSFQEPDGTAGVRITGIDHFQISQIFDCGQCFRFDPIGAPDQSEYAGVAFGRYVRFRQPAHDTLEILNATLGDYEALWKHYLTLDEDYTAVRDEIIDCFNAAAGGRDEIIAAALAFGSGIRILKQEPWETVCSFIVSQNNNITRIKKIIASLCRAYGEPIDHHGTTYYAFPTAKALADAGEPALYALRTGFRAKYIHDAAKRVASGTLDCPALLSASSDEAMERLCAIKGVGPKVASCAMLFGFGKTDAFPVDVWIKRVLEKYYPSGLDTAALGRYAGIAQQYLFYYERYGGATGD